jgi:hypothetical protein
LWQPIWLAVVLTLLVALPCGATIDQPPAHGQDHHARREVGGRPRDSQKTWENGDDRIPRLSAAGRQIAGPASKARDALFAEHALLRRLEL